MDRGAWQASPWGCIEDTNEANTSLQKKKTLKKKKHAKSKHCYLDEKSRTGKST